MKRGALLVLLALAGCRSAGKAQEELPFPLSLDFRGQESVEAERLEEVVRKELVRLEIREPDKAAVDDAAFALELYYRARGYADVVVEYEFQPGNPPRAVFTVEEGPQLRVRELVVAGPTGIAPERVREELGAVAVGSTYDELRWKQSLTRLRRFYEERGYLRVEVVAAPPDFDEAGTGVSLRVNVREGPVFRVESLTFRGGVATLAGRERELTQAYVSKLFQPLFRPEIEHALQEDYEHQGYPDAVVTVRAEMDESNGAVALRVDVTPGERVTIEHFRISGNVRTRDSAILGLIDIDKGTLYDSERIRKAFRDLYATGLFESVTLGLEGTGPERTLLVEVVETRSVEIRVEPGYGSYEGPRLLLGIQENNFQGLGQVLGLEGTVSTKAQSARISWVDRDFLGSSFKSETTFSVEKREEPAFTFVRRGLGFFLRRPVAKSWSTVFGYEYRPTDVDDDGFSTSLPLDSDPSSDASVAALSAALLLDNRDNVLLPTRGRQGRAFLEWADEGFGSDTEFLRAQVEFTQLVPIGEESVLVAAAHTGIIAPYGGTDFIPLPERFFNGGENSVRSFREDELPAEGTGGSLLGGEASTTVNLEWRRRIAGNLAGAVFYDRGNVVGDVQDYLKFEGFRSAVGFGLRYLLPIGPVRLDLGYNPDAGPQEDDYVLHFSVGFPF